MNNEFAEISDRFIGLANDHEVAIDLLNLLKSSDTPTKDFKSFLDCVDESNHSINEWLDACLYFMEYNREVNFHFSTMVGYITCSAEAAQSSLNNFSLTDLIKDFLDEYGFENQVTR